MSSVPPSDNSPPPPDGSAGTPNLVLNCQCQHKSPQNMLCQYVPGVSCGGPTKCPFCAGSNPIVQPLPPDVAGQSSGPQVNG